MATITVKPITYGQWGDCVQITNGTVEAIVTVAFGPRVIRYGFVGGINVFKEDTELKLVNEVVYRGQSYKWYNRGGHRLWVSPEAMPRSYYPDNDPVEWKATETGAIFTPPEETWHKLQKQVELSMDADTGKVTVIHRVTNTGEWPLEFAPWALSVMAQGGKAIVPQVKRQTGLLGNRVFALWPYSRMNDNRVTWGEHFIQLQQGPGATPFKMGTNNENGWGAYHLEDVLFIKQYEHRYGATYPDFGVSLELYVCDDFLELETLGVLSVVQPGETAVHQETWSLHRNVELPADELELDKELRRYLES